MKTQISRSFDMRFAQFPVYCLPTYCLPLVSNLAKTPDHLCPQRI